MNRGGIEIVPRSAVTAASALVLLVGCSHEGRPPSQPDTTRPVVATPPKPRHHLPTTPPGDPPPQNVPPTTLHQIAGQKEVSPDAETQAQLVAAGKRHVIASFKICVDNAGALTAVEKLTSTGYRAYDDALEAAIAEYRYEPYRIGDHAVPVCTALTFIHRPAIPETPRERALREWDEQQAHDRR